MPGSLQYALFGRCVFPGGLSQRIAVGACIVLLPFIRLADRLLGDGDVLHAVACKARTQVKRAGRRTRSTKAMLTLGQNRTDSAT